MIAVDQMRYDYLTRFAPLYKGGFKTLLDRGAVFTNALYRHAHCETAPGHSVILSGRHPSSTGIVENAWYDPQLKREINVVEDPASRPVGGPGRGASPANFIGFMIGDKLKEKWPQSRVVGISLKDRSAVLLTGHRADAAYWFENACGCFITSTYYAQQPPAWLEKFNSRCLADSYFKTPWSRLLRDEKLYLEYSREDDFPGEWDLEDTVFPHAHRGRPPDPAYYDNLRRTPFADDLLLEAALEAFQAHDLGTRSSPDLFAVSFSAGDVIGHTYGPSSQESMDEYLRLDLVLDKLLKAVDARVGLDQTLVILSADHGVMPLVEWLRKQGIKDTRRVPATALENTVQKALKARFPSAGNLIATFHNPHFTLNLEAIHQHGLDRAEVERTAIKALLATGAVAAVYTHADMFSKGPAEDPFIALFRNSFFPARSPHLMVLPKKYYYIDNHPGGTGHGTPYEYDRHVPIVWMGAGIKPGRYADAAGPEDIAPTLAKMLGIDYPLEPDSRLLTEALAGMRP
ncbi:MAG: alkaline phosphatase family protein [Acidobacteria bacterium]|nr:alkaline phosphatase family protein [Acidobacteriota bacterium]